MYKSFSRSIARILSNNNTVVGAGFLISSQYLVSCSHVITRALGIADDSSMPPSDTIKIDFPLTNPRDYLNMRVVSWKPYATDGINDIAVLEFITPPPNGMATLNLVTSDSLWGHSFRAYGFPKGQPDGVWASGVFRGKQANGWIQMESVEPSGYRVESGFSGTPIWDESLNAVVGMAVAAETNPSIRAAFMIPIHHISQTWKDASLLVDNTAAKPIQANPSTVLSIPHIAGFIGRKDILEKTVTAINSEGLMIVQGLAGIGKTTLVAKATKLSTSIFHDVAWIKCIENTSYDYIVLRLTQFLAGYGTEDMLSSVVKGASLPAPDQFFPEFLNIIQTLKVLIIFDDFDNALNRYRYISDNRLSQLIEMLIEHSYESKIVLVTRFIPKIRSKYQYQTVKIGGLNCATSVDLFKKSVQGDYESIMYQEVHNLTGGHPFAIRILASLTQYYPLQHLLADKALYLDECGQNLLQRLFSTIPNKEVLITKRLSVLRMAFSLDAFMGIGGEIKNVESMIARFLLDFDVSSAVYSIHPLIRDYSYKNTRPSIRKEYHREAADYFSSKFFIGRLDVHNADDAIEASYHFSRAGDLQNTIAIPIGFTESLHFLGVSYFRKKQYVKSESCFDAILKLDDSDTRGHFYYAASIDLQGQSRRENSSATIEEHYQRALDVQPNNVQYIDYYAYFLMNLNHYPQAEELFRKGVQLGATCPTLYRRYGLLMKRLGQIDQAEKIFSKGCKIAYKNGLIYLEYARMKLERGKFREAEDIIVAGLSVNRGFKPLVTALDTLKKNREI